MVSTLAAVVVAVYGAMGLLGYFTHRLIYLLQTEVDCVKTVAAHQEERAERINRAIGTEE